MIGGPAGTGKTTAASKLSAHFGCPYIEGDALHPTGNIRKMSKGIPLTDDDRWEWLEKLTKTTVEKCKDSDSHMAIVTCSMLKKLYRQLIRECSSAKVIFCFLYATFEELVNRVENRQNHYMKSDMVRSQYEIMEVPGGEEMVDNGGDCLVVDTTDKNTDEIYEELCRKIYV